MVERLADLPDYERPPVDEVSVGLQYIPIVGSESQTGRYWESIRDAYPNSQSVPRIELPVEQLQSAPMPPMIMVSPSTAGRTWLISEDDSLLVQVQSDRFILNWRRRRVAYPRFEKIHEEFWRTFDSYRATLTAASLPTPVLQQTEVAYINWITDDAAPAFLRAAKSSTAHVEGVDPEPELFQWAVSYLARENGRPFARLYANCVPALRLMPNMERGIQFSLTVRVPQPPSATDDDVRDVLRRSSHIIVRAFTDLTTDESQRKWGRLK